MRGYICHIRLNYKQLASLSSLVGEQGSKSATNGIVQDLASEPAEKKEKSQRKQLKSTLNTDDSSDDLLFFFKGAGTDT